MAGRFKWKQRNGKTKQKYLYTNVHDTSISLENDKGNGLNVHTYSQCLMKGL